MLCRHCRVKKASRSRGLCWSCFYAPGVRDLYPIDGKVFPNGTCREPTEAELAAMIAEQLPTMPPWGNDENDIRPAGESVEECGRVPKRPVALISRRRPGRRLR